MIFIFTLANDISLCGLIVDADLATGLAKKVQNFNFGGKLKNSH
mgnify:CR=1 FL=1|tara:strand:- start:628 stop:759 length:132 start_codon:yes stop_codon:yes gene_type:complete